jgi:hypothetical protein
MLAQCLPSVYLQESKIPNLRTTLLFNRDLRIIPRDREGDYYPGLAWLRWLSYKEARASRCSPRINVQRNGWVHSASQA